MEKKLRLVAQQSTYKMIIPEQVEKKIRLLCREIHNVEWSGILFYKVEGTFEDSNLVITCVDIFQMDEGSATYTEYNMSPDVCTYICDHPELAESNIFTGLIHSHNNMATFFSGTDNNTLQAEGSDMSHFVSLIVNNAGKYTARVTRRVKEKIVGTCTSQYPTWGGATINPSTKNIEYEEEYIEYFNLDIDIESISNDFETEMLERIKDIREAKARRTPLYISNKTTSEHNPIPTYPSYPKPEEKPKEIEEEKDEPIDYENVSLNEDLIDWVVKQTITCSVVIPKDSKINVKTWAQNMGALYKKRFGTVQEFEGFAVNFIDYLVNYTIDLDAQPYLDNIEMSSILAYKVREKLSKLPKNEWLDCLIKLYDDYIF